MIRNAFTSFVTDSGNKTIPLPPYSRSFITFWVFFVFGHGESIPFCYEKRFSNVTSVHAHSSPFVVRSVDMSLFCKLDGIWAEYGIGAFFGIVHTFKCFLPNANPSEYVNCFRSQRIIGMSFIGNGLHDTKEFVDNYQIQLLPQPKIVFSLRILLLESHVALQNDKWIHKYIRIPFTLSILNSNISESFVPIADHRLSSYFWMRLSVKR